ncbi:hypothetical protein [Mitsuokella multacida]|uniref:hypothetical protein n=1 Tax=Mitsuokella multacida TaxID=52226 RepID=UPI002432BADD|nr:hypothetical protein [Mitsuokella multacida]
MEPLLKIYYKRYLSEVRRLKPSTVNHYCDALNNITRHLQEMKMIKGSIYDISDLHQLKDLRAILFADPSFIAQNKKGNQMYSAGLNNYVKFAEGTNLPGLRHDIAKLDMPMPVIAEEPKRYEIQHWARSDILREQTLAVADYHCEMDGRHQTFVAERTHKPYMESHHAIPIHLQDRFHTVWMFMPISSVFALYAIARSIMACVMSAVRCCMRYTKSAMNAWRIAGSR